jgi:hypothetical protein
MGDPAQATVGGKEKDAGQWARNRGTAASRTTEDRQRFEGWRRA